MKVMRKFRPRKKSKWSARWKPEFYMAQGSRAIGVGYTATEARLDAQKCYRESWGKLR